MNKFNCKYMAVLLAAGCIVSLTGCSDNGASADVQNVTSAASETPISEMIGLDEAENAALVHAGVAENAAVITKAELDRDNGNYEYEIEFTAQNYKYEYDINAVDGSVLKFKKEALTETSETAVQTAENPSVTVTETQPSATNKQENAQHYADTQPLEVTTKPAVTTASSYTSEKMLTAEEAKSAALKHAGLTASEVTFTKAKLDYDDGIAEYEIEFYSSADEYDYEINASTGMVIKYSKETLELPAMNTAAAASDSVTITIEDAKAIALEYAGLTASDVKFTKTELDYDDGRAEYEIEFKYGMKEYEFKIDAASGKILEAEID